VTGIKATAFPFVLSLQAQLMSQLVGDNFFLRQRLENYDPSIALS
jgi:hypothetical protein